MFVLSAMDITSTSKTKPQEEHDHATSRISFLNLPLSSGTLTPSLAEPVAISIIHPIYLQFNSLILQTNVPITLHTLHQPCFSSTLQLTTHIHPCYDHITDGTRRISNLPTSLTSIPHQALLDRHCTHITWKSGMALELFKRQLTRTQQFLRSLEQHPLASPQLLTSMIASQWDTE